MTDTDLDIAVIDKLNWPLVIVFYPHKDHAIHVTSRQLLVGFIPPHHNHLVTITFNLYRVYIYILLYIYIYYNLQ